MGRKKEEISAERLFEVSDAVLTAVQTFEREQGTRSPWPPELVSHPFCPPCLYGMERDEVAEATDFLIRMGYIVVPGMQ